MGIKLDASQRLPVYSPVCTLCKHWTPGTGQHGRTCAAFTAPDSIPESIWTGANDHRQPVAGDNGITFEPLRKP